MWLQHTQLFLLKSCDDVIFGLYDTVTRANNNNDDDDAEFDY